MKVLVIEDSPALTEFICDGLQRLGYAVDSAADGEVGLWYAETNVYEVIVLDLMLPKLSGLEILRALRTAGNPVHVLILTAKDAVPDRISGLDAGADDYLAKPFEFLELVARIRALTRRTQHAKNPRLRIADSIELDTNGRVVLLDGKPLPVPLTPKEYGILELLAYQRGKVVTRTEIENSIYDDKVEPMSNVVDVAIYSLRRKLAASGISDLVQTRRGIGYIINPLPEDKVSE